MFGDKLKLEIPESFPLDAYTRFIETAEAIGAHNGEFGGARNLIGWRFRSCHEHMFAYVTSWRTLGQDVGFEEIYSRERNLFGMFSAGVSCVESACYAAYAYASNSRVLGLPFGSDEQRLASLRVLQKVIAQIPAGATLLAPLDAIGKSDDWRTWVELRNRMTHRSNLPRHIRSAIGGPAPTAEAAEFAATSSTRPFSASPEELEGMVERLGSML